MNSNFQRGSKFNNGRNQQRWNSGLGRAQYRPRGTDGGGSERSGFDAEL
jgi:hypothetical protein